MAVTAKMRMSAARSTTFPESNLYSMNVANGA
jgi:hypothetical protein